jgi:hypothetical protein
MSDEIRRRRWYLKLPNYFYAIGPFEWLTPVSQAAARAHMRVWLGASGPALKRLPRGCDVYSPDAL